MIRKKLDDIKINTHKIVKTFKEDVVVNDIPENKDIIDIPITKKILEEDKYEFLEKKKKIEASHEVIHTQRIPHTPHMKKGKPFNKFILFIFILALILGVFYLFSTVFYKANITIIPKNKIFELKDESFTSSKKNDIPFEVMIVDDTLSKEVILTSSEEVNNKARGEITLYNEYAKTPQKITVGSFITDENGKSYKIDSTVTIPGYTVDKRAKMVPGQVVAGITSFLAGEAYNGSPNSFSITSFKNTDKYKKIYGELKTPLTGGIAGLVYVVDDKEKELILKDVSTSEDRLMKKLNALVPTGYILYPNAVDFSYDLGDSTFSKIPDAKIDVKGTLKAILLKNDDLASYIIDKLLPDISKEEKAEITSPDLSVLTFSFTNKDQVITKDMDSFDFNLNGNITLDWNPNSDLLKAQLLGKDKKELTNIFKTDPGIGSANVNIIPFWSSKLPNAIEKINIIMKK